VTARRPDCHVSGPRIVMKVMTQTLPTSTTATPRDDARTPQPSDPTFGEMLLEVFDLSAGFAVALLPALLLALPGLILFFIAPAVLLLVLAAPLAVIAALLAGPPYLVVRWLRRRRRRTPTPPAGAAANGALRSVRTSGQPRVPQLGRG
jgi:Flp pilus assembly protein TadB